MRYESLTSPGILSNGFTLRREAAKAISAIEITCRATPGGKTRAAAALSAFFTSCVDSLSTLIDAVAPTVVTRIRTATNTAVITMSETLDTSVTPATSAFVFSPVRTVTAVVVSGTTITITATGVIATDTVTYTQPATNGARDRAGNLIATFTGVLA